MSEKVFHFNFILLFISLYSTFLHSMCKFHLLCLTYFMQHLPYISKFLQMTSIPLCMYTRFYFTPSSLDENLGWFHVLATVSNAVINTREYTSPQHTIFTSFGYHVTVKRTLYIVFRNGDANLHLRSSQQWLTSPFLYILCPTLFFIIPVLTVFYNSNSNSNKSKNSF